MLVPINSLEERNLKIPRIVSCWKKYGKYKFCNNNNNNNNDMKEFIPLPFEEYLIAEQNSPTRRGNDLKL